ncbi:hypothetical protein [Methylobacterium platani]|nr:hypothetical protein [Methylobacterium platani]
MRRGISGTQTIAASAGTSAANAAARTRAMMRVTSTNRGVLQMSGDAVSRAYCSVKGCPAASEASTISSRPASTTRRTAGMVQS